MSRSSSSCGPTSGPGSSKAVNAGRRRKTQPCLVLAVPDWSGARVQPVRALGSTYYYKKGNRDPRAIRSFPQCNAAASDCTGLKMISDQRHWGCTSGQRLANPPDCTGPDASHVLVAGTTFPDCWDGVNLDSANHRDHMAYSVADGPDADPYRECPPPIQQRSHRSLSSRSGRSAATQRSTRPATASPVARPPACIRTTGTRGCSPSSRSVCISG